jgi:hypothetical protein
LEGYVKKGTVKQWLEYLVQTPLYKYYNITIDQDFLDIRMPEETFNIEEMHEQASDIEWLLAQQLTLLWNEDKYLEIAPGQHSRTLSIMYDDYAE